ncbi:hypothetical protein BJV74DRAFT_884982 [Russula compacta]|nr:hypothetical protein BJV74DRAFT_884982 [Russula compacta]
MDYQQQDANQRQRRVSEHPQEARRAPAATFLTGTSSTLGYGCTRDNYVPASANASPTVGQRQPAASSTRKNQPTPARDEVLAGGAQPQSPPLGQRQRARDARNAATSVADGAQQQLPSPGPGRRLPEWDRRGSATSSAARSRSERSTSGRSCNGNGSETAAGQRQQPLASARKGAGAGAGGRTRGSVSGRSLDLPFATSTVPPDGGFPTFAHTSWGDPIAIPQSRLSTSSRRKRKSSSAKNNSSNDDNNNNDDDDASTVPVLAPVPVPRKLEARKQGNGLQNSEPESGSEKKSRAPGPGQKNNGKDLHRRVVTAAAAVAAAAQVTLPRVMHVEFPRGGPGSSWGDPNAQRSVVKL